MTKYWREGKPEEMIWEKVIVHILMAANTVNIFICPLQNKAIYIRDVFTQIDLVLTSGYPS